MYINEGPVKLRYIHTMEYYTIIGKNEADFYVIKPNYC